MRRRIAVHLLTLAAFIAAVLPAPARALGIVSRSCAPLGTHESITVDWHFQPHYLKTVSFHYLSGFLLHAVQSENNSDDGWIFGWRAYAGYLGKEFRHGEFIGQHYAYAAGVIAFLGTSTATDCKLRQWG
jgi:hypothetical protein